MKEEFMEKISLQMQTEGAFQRKSKQKVNRSKTKGDLEVLEEVDDESDSAISQKQEKPRKQKKREAGVSAGIDINDSSLEKCDGEPVPLQLKRWMKIANDYVKKDGRYDISKIPEICDNIKFDNLHIPESIEDNEDRLLLMELSQMLCRVIVPMEYGVTTEEKIDVGC